MSSPPRKLSDPPTEENPVLAAFLHPPVDERPETDEERAAVATAQAEAHASGRRVPHDEVMAGIDRRRSGADREGTEETFAQLFPRDPLLGLVIFHEDPTAPLHPEDWPDASGDEAAS